MFISTKGRYGARAMLALAARYDTGPMRANEIAEEQGISQKYLESLLATLKSAGLITAERGSRGGYTLVRRPSQITLYDVLLPLEDLSGIVHCSGANSKCERFEECVTREVWEEMQNSAVTILKKKNLGSLLRKKK